MSDNLRLIELFNNHFPDFKFDSHQIEFSRSEKTVSILDRPKGRVEIDLFTEFIDSLYFKNLETKYLYHYLPIEFIDNIMKDDKIRLYNLAKYIKDNNDPKEFSYFINRIGLIIPNAEKYLSSVVNDFFILSCTTEENSIDHWNYYGKEKGAACICFSIKKVKNDHDVDVQNVVYESQLTKLFCLQQCIQEEFDYKLDLSKVYQFSKFVKRSYYEWEREVRICFDHNAFQIGKKFESFLTNNKNIKSKHDKYFVIKEDDSLNKYIEVPIKNNFFELKIKSIQVKSDSCHELRSICKEKGIKFIV